MTKHLLKLTKVVMFFTLCMVGVSAFAQLRPVNGKITDASGAPITGASVVLVGNERIYTITDTDGKFTLAVPAGANLNVSFIGYVSQVVAVGDRSSIEIILQEDTEVLEEVVVVGYGVQKKSDVTGAVSSVKAVDLENRSTTDAAAALQGKVSGVHIITTGNPGSGATIRVRGYSSNSGNISPLLVVDGLKVSSIQYLDPSMIESMEVLKDAASAAIYGAEAGNGVVLITTKTGGSSGHSTVTYSGKATLQDFHKRPLMARDQFLEYMGLEYGDDFVNNKLSDFDYRHPDYPNGIIDQDWMSAYLDPTWSYQNSLSFSGGNNNGHFFTSINYVHDDGVVKGQKDVYKRLTAQVNADYQLFKWLQVGTNTSMEKWSTQSVSQRGYSSSFESLIMIDPLTPVYWTTPEEMSIDVKTQYDRILAGGAGRPYRFFGDENGWFANTKYSDLEGSPFAKRDATDADNGGINVNGSFFANLTPFKGFTFTSRFGYRISQSTSHSYTAPYYIGPRGSQDNYSISATANTGLYYQWENFANYNITIAGKHNITAMAGMSYIENTSDNVTGSSSGADILSAYQPQFIYLNYVKGDASKTISNAPSISAQLAYFGRLIYSYDNRYSIQANFRADAFDSSKLPADKRWGKFPSFSAGWNISNESWFKENVSSNAISFLKLRASWGRNGNISVLSGYPYSSTINLGNNWYQYSVDKKGSTFASAPSGLPNPNLTWETSEQYDFGLDARFLDNRMSLTVDYFNKKTKDLLFSKTLSPELGVSSSTVNGGDVLNRGLEFEFSWKDAIGDFHYSIGGNFSTLHNEVLSLPEGTARIERKDASSTNYQTITVFEAGHPIWYIMGYQYLGENTDGSLNFADLNNDGAIDAKDMISLGQPTPKFTYGLTINLEWKGIDFMLFGSGLGGNTIVPVLHRTGFTNAFQYYYDQYKEGVYPNPSKTAGDLRFWSSDANAFKGDFFRIKQMQLGYSLPQRLTKKALISNLRFYVSMDDYFTFTNYFGFDPETASTNSTSGGGLDWGSYPTMQKITFGINLTF